MQKKIHLITLSLILIGGIWMTRCVSPYYGTARIESGWQLDVGLGLHSTVVPLFDADPMYGIGIRCDGEIGYGLDKYVKPYARAALDLNTAYIGYADIGLGLQVALPVWIFTPAVKLEINSTWIQPTFSPVVLLGIGKSEWVTLGAKTYFFPFADSNYPEFLDVFATAHISPRWSIFAGAEINSFIDTFEDDNGYPFFTVGAGYKFPPFRGKTRL
ncbi:hypothetical protein ES703_10770 [subsurface metagenome]|nr:hypothetical protein [bacterium]